MPKVVSPAQDWASSWAGFTERFCTVNLTRVRSSPTLVSGRWESCVNVLNIIVGDVGVSDLAGPATFLSSSLQPTPTKMA